MIVDASALIALIENEQPYSPAVAAALSGHGSVDVGAPTAAECLIVLTSRHGPRGRTAFERLRTDAVAAVTREPLVAVGNDFAQTDLEFDGGVVGHWPTP